MFGGGSPLAVAACISACPITWPKSLSGSSAAICVRPCACTAATSRRTCWPGVMPSVQTPGCACDGSLVKASTATLAARATGATAAVSVDISGPMMSLAPSAIAACAAAAAPCGVPPVSFTSSMRRARHRQGKLRRLRQRLAEVRARAGQRHQDGNRARCAARRLRHRLVRRPGRSGRRRHIQRRSRRRGSIPQPPPQPASARGPRSRNARRRMRSIS